MDEHENPSTLHTSIPQPTSPTSSHRPSAPVPPDGVDCAQWSLAATAVVAGIGGIGAGYAIGHGGLGSSSRPTSSSSQLTGLVRVTSALEYEGGETAGTGMVLTSDGEVVTNHHVIAGATSVEVTGDVDRSELPGQGGGDRRGRRRRGPPTRRRVRPCPGRTTRRLQHPRGSQTATDHRHRLTRYQTSTELRRAVAARSAGDRERSSWTDRVGTSRTATVTLAAGAFE